MVNVFQEVRNAYLKDDILDYIENEELLDESEFNLVDLDWIVQKYYDYHSMEYSMNFALQEAIESYFDYYGQNFKTYKEV